MRVTQLRDVSGDASEGMDRLLRQTSIEDDGEEGAFPGRSREWGRSIRDAGISRSGGARARVGPSPIREIP